MYFDIEIGQKKEGRVTFELVSGFPEFIHLILFSGFSLATCSLYLLLSLPFSRVLIQIMRLRSNSMMMVREAAGQVKRIVFSKVTSCTEDSRELPCALHWREGHREIRKAFELQRSAQL